MILDLRRRRASRGVRHAHVDGPRLRRPPSLGEVGHCGGRSTRRRHGDGCSTASTSGVTTSMTISGPAVLLCMCRRGREGGRRHRPAQRHAADRHLQGVHRPEGVAVPARPHLRLIGDLMTSGRGGAEVLDDLGVRLPHPRGRLDGRAGTAFTLADGFGYVELGSPRPRRRRSGAGLSFFFDAHIDFFEEIAKFRAARRIWARWLRDLFGAQSRRRGGCASTPRRRVSPSRLSSQTSTSSAPASRRSPQCSAAPEPCTRTASTRPSHCPARGGRIGSAHSR